ncbi:MAG: thiamine phosphate synthase [Dehalococcoidia bacterium]
MIDANLNRSSEGLRLLEDVARFLLNDAETSGRLRTLRHDLAHEAGGLRVELLSERDSESDVGRHQPVARPSTKSEPAPPVASAQSLVDLVTANAKRVQQSLRVMEELAKLPDISSVLDSSAFERARFDLYALERDLVSRISRRHRVQGIQGLYVVLDRQCLAGRDEVDIARQIIDGGARTIQLRDKAAVREDNKRGLLLVAQELKELCRQAGLLFIMNDYLDLAIAVDADGLHIGQNDLPLPVVRKQLPIDRIVGCSVTTLSQAEKAQAEGADYIAVGSVYPTATKEAAIVVGLDRLKELRPAVSVPLVAIGGINPDNIGEVMAAGADAAAVVSAVLREDDLRGAVQQLIARLGPV